MSDTLERDTISEDCELQSDDFEEINHKEDKVDSLVKSQSVIVDVNSEPIHYSHHDYYTYQLDHLMLNLIIRKGSKIISNTCRNVFKSYYKLRDHKKSNHDDN